MLRDVRWGSPRDGGARSAPRGAPRREGERPDGARGHPGAGDGLGAIPGYAITDDFDKDFGVGEWHDTNAFIRDGDKIFRTYFADARGDEAMGNTWNYLDLTALGRQEEWEDSPEGYAQTRPTSGGTTRDS
jgi:hypothetical protein